MSLKVLYGSQNFGYDLSDSDRDHAEIVMPTITDVLHNKILSSTRHEEDGSQTKLIDVRRLPYLFNKSNFNDLQILYSVERSNDKKFEWFYENRDKIVKHNLSQSYCSNKGFIETCIKQAGITKDYKCLLRAYAFTCMLEQLTHDKPFEMHNPHLKAMRINKTPISVIEIYDTLERILPFFDTKKTDEDLVQSMYDKCYELLTIEFHKEVHYGKTL